MTTSSSRRFRWTALAASLASLGALPTAFASDPATTNGVVGLALIAEDAPEARDLLSDFAGAGQELYLEVTLNQTATGRLARFVLRDDTLHAGAATLRGLGLQWPGSAEASGLLALWEIPGLQVEYDAARQRISLLVPAQAPGG